MSADCVSDVTAKCSCEFGEVDLDGVAVVLLEVVGYAVLKDRLLSFWIGCELFGLCAFVVRVVGLVLGGCVGCGLSSVIWLCRV